MSGRSMLLSREERGVTKWGWGSGAKPVIGVPAPAPVLNAPDTTAALQPEGRVPVTIGLTGPSAMCCGRTTWIVEAPQDT